MTKNGIMTKLT